MVHWTGTYRQFKGCLKSIFYYHFIHAFKLENRTTFVDWEGGKV